jgi:hypothetical protein
MRVAAPAALLASCGFEQQPCFCMLVLVAATATLLASCGFEQ